MKLDLEIWRQSGPRDGGRFASYEMDEAVPDMSFLELLDVLNERLERSGEEPVAFEHDCREGICGSCGFLINGRAHGPRRGVTVCQLHLRHFHDGERMCWSRGGRAPFRCSRTWWWTAPPSTA